VGGRLEKDGISWIHERILRRILDYGIATKSINQQPKEIHVLLLIIEFLYFDSELDQDVMKAAVV
jgi:hypothetical protein